MQQTTSVLIVAQFRCTNYALAASHMRVFVDNADSIEANVETAAVSVEEGIDQLRQARRSQVGLIIEITLCFCVSCTC